MQPLHFFCFLDYIDSCRLLILSIPTLTPLIFLSHFFFSYHYGSFYHQIFEISCFQTWSLLLQLMKATVSAESSWPLCFPLNLSTLHRFLQTWVPFQHIFYHCSFPGPIILTSDNMSHSSCFIWLRDMDTKKIRAEVFRELWNVCWRRMEKIKWSEKVTNEKSSWPYRREEDTSK